MNFNCCQASVIFTHNSTLVELELFAYPNLKSVKLTPLPAYSHTRSPDSKVPEPDVLTCAVKIPNFAAPSPYPAKTLKVIL